MKNGWCHWALIPVKFPNDYAIELISTWKKGNYDEYGLMLTESNTKYYTFQIRGDGSASYAVRYEANWIENANWFKNKANKGDGLKSNIQRLEIRTDYKSKVQKFRYLINNELFTEGILKKIKPQNIALSNCGEQTVAFNNLKLIDLTNGDILINDKFSSPSKLLIPDSSITHSFQITNGKFIAISNQQGSCFSSTINYPLFGNYETILESNWIEGKDDLFGLMFMFDDDNYFSFEIRFDGAARFVCFKNGKFEKIGKLHEMVVPLTNDHKFTQKIRVQHEQFEYFVNDIFIDSGKFQGMVIKMIGLRICGHQKIAFNSLNIKPLE